MSSELENVGLLPCPFCGGAAVIGGDTEVGFCVICGPCRVAMGEEYDRAAYPNHDFRTEADAIAAWNHRTPSSSQSGTLEEKK